MFKINIQPEHFQGVTRISPNEIRAMSLGDEVVFRRVVAGWNVELAIFVEGRCVHQDSGAAERDAWDELSILATAAAVKRDADTDAAKARVCERLFK